MRKSYPPTQARSQDLEKGGAFLKEWEKCKRPWPEFSLFLNQFHTVCPKIETEFLGKLGSSNVFSAQIQVVYWVWFFGQNRKFKRIFSPKTGGLQKKKGRSSPKLSLIFRPKSEIQTFFQPKNRWSTKKKKEGLHRNWVWFFGQNRKFKRFFSPKTGGLQKKKKEGLHRNSVWFFGQNRKFKRFFSPKTGGLQKKKKRKKVLHRNSVGAFWPT